METTKYSRPNPPSQQLPLRINDNNRSQRDNHNVHHNQNGKIMIIQRFDNELSSNQYQDALEFHQLMVQDQNLNDNYDPYGTEHLLSPTISIFM